MKDFLKHYKVKIHALSPVHIGSGEKIGAKEYIYLPANKKVIIPDTVKMFADLQKKSMEKEFVSYILSNRGYSLGSWLERHNFDGNDFRKWEKYELYAGKAFCNSPRNQSQKKINTFIKNAYGLPYIPGSSLKGMFRTALLAYEVNEYPQRYADIRRQIQINSGMKTSRNDYLLSETEKLEQKTFNRTAPDRKRKENNFNDSCLSGLLVSDSDPIPVENLALCQKVDYSVDGNEKFVPNFWETLIPGTDICFSVSIDATRCSYTMNDIMKALERFQQICYRYFYSGFHRGTKEKNIVWLGGGCGFLSKTILYPLFEMDAVKITDTVFKNTLGEDYYTHQHMRNMQLKTAPHVCKCTYYRGKLYDMGMGRIEVVES